MDIYFGIEWEPQFTFLDFKQCPVYFNKDFKRAIITERENKEKYILILLLFEDIYHIIDEVYQQIQCQKDIIHNEGTFYRNMKQRIDVDASNIEIRTYPVYMLDQQAWKQELLISNLLLKQYMIMLAQHYGPVACFFPSTCVYDIKYAQSCAVTKHINVSLSKAYQYMKYEHKFRFVINIEKEMSYKYINLKKEDELSRQHIRIPYNFKDYGMIKDVIEQKRKFVIPIQKEPILISYMKDKNHYIQVKGLF